MSNRLETIYGKNDINEYKPKISCLGNSYLEEQQKNYELDNSHKEQKDLVIRKNKGKIVIMCIVIIICLISILGLKYSKHVQKAKINKYAAMMQLTENQVKESQEKLKEEQRIIAEQKRIKQEQELKAKMETRNFMDFTQEQIYKIKHIYSNNGKKIAYLTFDDGPSSNVTPLILDVLKSQNIKATFFVLGLNVSRNPEILKRENLEGHYIANHGYSHKYEVLYANIESLINEFNMCEQAIKDALGNQNYKTRIFRFPGGSTGGKYAQFKKEAKAKLEEINITYIDWNALTCDAEGTPTKESILENLKKTTEGKNTVVILMHDSSTKILTYETLNDVISYLKQQGYEFGDLYDVIGE